jgi:hypothetical protein
MNRPVVRLLIWTISLALLYVLTLPLTRRILPRTVESTWTTTIDASGARATIRATRNRGGDYTEKLPIDSADISLADSRGEHPPIHIGPNVYICTYTDRAGKSIRGASPPDVAYLAGWLKEIGGPESLAGAVAMRMSQVYVADTLNHNSLGPEWMVSRTSSISRVTWVVFNTSVFVIWLAGLWYTLIPRK